MPDGDRLKTRLSTKGQVILPKAVRDRHGWTAGTVLAIEDRPDAVTLRPAKAAPLVAPTRLEDVAGMLADRYDGPPVSIEDMNKVIENDLRRRYATGRY